MRAFLPFLVLIALIVCCVAVFGSATLDGGSRMSLLAVEAVSFLAGYLFKRLNRENLEQEMISAITKTTSFSNSVLLTF